MLAMRTRVSRLCYEGLGPMGLREVLDFNTSEEVLHQMVKQGDKWSLYNMVYDIKLDAGNLLEMVVKGVGSEVVLEPKQKFDSGLDVFLRFQHVRKGSAVRQGQDAAKAKTASSAKGGDNSQGEGAMASEEFSLESELAELLSDDLNAHGGCEGGDYSLEAELGAILDEAYGPVEPEGRDEEDEEEGESAEPKE